MSPEDVLGAAAARDWPPVFVPGMNPVEGEALWRGALNYATPEERDALYEALQRFDSLDAARVATELGERRDVTTARGYIPPPSAGDVLRVAAFLEWPALTLPDGRPLDGEAAWREAVSEAGADLMPFWQALQATGEAARAARASEDAESDDALNPAEDV